MGNFNLCTQLGFNSAHRLPRVGLTWIFQHTQAYHMRSTHTSFAQVTFSTRSRHSRKHTHTHLPCCYAAPPSQFVLVRVAAEER